MNKANHKAKNITIALLCLILGYLSVFVSFLFIERFGQDALGGFIVPNHFLFVLWIVYLILSQSRHYSQATTQFFVFHRRIGVHWFTNILDSVPF